MSELSNNHKCLQVFADAVRSKMTQLTIGEPEDQLRGPFENYISAVAKILKKHIVCTGETPLPGRIGRPDYAVHLNKLLTGYVELKAPGVGANYTKFKGHNLDQWKRFSAIPNLLYTDGNEWALYRSGEVVDRIVSFNGNIAVDGKRAVTAENADAVDRLLGNFLSWEPIIPTDRNGKVNLKEFAALLAPLCRMLRDDVTEALKDSTSPLIQLAKDWRQLLFPDAPDEQFADAYAQTVAFALLLGRSEGANPLTFDRAEATLAAQHNLLSRALQVLTDPSARAEMAASLELLIRIIAVIPPATLSGPEDPWLYFYEDFLAAYDPKLRKDAGAYYTPIEVVHAQVRLIDDILVNRFGKPLGFADPSVITLDPATGTGTYLLGVIEHALSRIEVEQGAGAVQGQASALAKNLYGFELMVGPYAVTELRISRALSDRGASLPKDGTHIYLTDTLESPHAIPPQLPLYLKPIAEQHAKALRVKKKVPVIVCLGNPPYDRHDAVDTSSESNLSRFGGWVRFGDPLPDVRKRDKKGNAIGVLTTKARLSEREKEAILKDFLSPTIAAGHGISVKNLYNLYVYFWRWALWKVFEQEDPSGPGIVSFISASSYIDGNAFCGMREHMRRLCDEIWILDLGGEGRGARKSDNVFAIQTPVAIAVAIRSERKSRSDPARVHYARIEGARNAKLSALDELTALETVKWQSCSTDWQSPFRPAGKGRYFEWPLMTDLMPWQHSGAQFKRTWPICSDSNTLKRRWQGLMASKEREVPFRETRDRKINSKYTPLLEGEKLGESIARLSRDADPPRIERYAYRSFDRQWVIADSRLGDFLRPILWGTVNERQVFLTSAFTQAISGGPSVVASSHVPDLHHFSGRGAKDVVPLYRDAACTVTNILPGLLDILGTTYKRTTTPEDFLSYIYGTLAHPGFTCRYEMELDSRELRVPITKDVTLFKEICATGAQLLWLHTYGERFVPKGEKSGQVPSGVAKCVKGIPGDVDGYPRSFSYNETTRTLHIGNGEFAPVNHEVFEFEVSGLKVVQSWLKYRMKEGAGKKSSPLDDIHPERWTSQFTTELLQLLWVLEASIEIYPIQAKLLDAVVHGPCFQADELPGVPDEMRQPPARPRVGGDLFDEI